MSDSQPINISFKFRKEGQEIICSATVDGVAHNAAWCLERFALTIKHLGSPRAKALMIQDALTQLLKTTEL